MYIYIYIHIYIYKKIACASHTSPALVSGRHYQRLLSRSSVCLHSGGRLFFLLFLVVPIQPVCVSGRTPTIAPRPHAIQVRPFVTHREALQHQQLLVDPCLLDAPPRVDLGEDSWQLKDLLRTEGDEVVLSPPLQQGILHGHQRRQAQLLEVFFKGGWSSGVEVVVCATTAFPPPTPGEQPRRAGEASVKEALYQPGAHEHIQSL